MIVKPTLDPNIFNLVSHTIFPMVSKRIDLEVMMPVKALDVPSPNAFALVVKDFSPPGSRSVIECEVMARELLIISA